MSTILLISLVLSFAAAMYMTPKLIRFLEAVGIVGTDIQKRSRQQIAEMGGPAVLTGFLVGIFAYIGAKVFFYGEPVGLVEIFAAITTILIISIIGFFDDIGSLSSLRKRDFLGNIKRVGLKQWQKPLLTLPAAIPLMAIFAGDYVINIPFLGPTNAGLLYPLLLIPIGVVGASNAVNMLAGMNGLEAGMGSILLLTLGVYAWLVGSTTASVIALVYAVALLAFLRYNWYPARIMPGDSLVYGIGAVVAVIAILGNIEKFALYCFALWFVEFLLKLRSKFKAENFGVLRADGTLEAPYKKIYSLTHLVMKAGRFTENQVVLTLMLAQLLIGVAFICYFLPNCLMH
jgi:UDP-N-acetylglucosamine--dolichyl-phosphate N-acetylglucosaminephosphotransferase